MKKQVSQGKWVPFIKEDLDSDGKDADKKNLRFSSGNLFLTSSQIFLIKEEVIEQLKAILGDKRKEFIDSRVRKHDETFWNLNFFN